jgi:hypothetical protein
MGRVFSYFMKRFQSPQEILGHSVLGAIVSFLKACVLRGGITFVIQLFKVLRGKRSFVTAVQHSIGPTTLRFGYTIGLFSFIWKFLNNTLELMRRKRSKLNSGIAGFVGGLAILLETKATRKNVSQQLFMRSTHAFINARKERNLFTLRNGDTYLFMFSYAMILFAGAFYSHTIPKAYFQWCVKLSKMPVPLLQFQEWHVREEAKEGRLLPVDKVHLMGLMEKFRGTPYHLRRVEEHLHKHNGYWIGNTCSIMHPHTNGCGNHCVGLFASNYSALLPMYMSVSGVPYVLFKTKRLLKEPITVLVRIVKSGMRSTLFMSTSVAVTQLTHCISSQFFPLVSPKVNFFVSGLFAGCTVLIEQKSRRAELAMFVLPKALEALYKIMISNGKLLAIPYLDVFGTCSSMGIVMALYQKEPRHIAPFLRGAISFLVGET